MAGETNAYDVVVIGGGAAGLSAALVLGRARWRVMVVDAGSPRNAPAAHMHGFLSRDGTPPADLLRMGREEVIRYGGDLIDDRVDGIEPADAVGDADGAAHRFIVRLASGRELRARRLLVATGLRDEVPDVPGVRERWARDVLHCPFCHGWEVRDQPLGVLAGDGIPAELAVDHALLIRHWSPDVVFFPRALALDAEHRQRLAASGVQVEEGEVRRLVVEDDRLRGVELADRVVPRAAIFVGVRFSPRNELLTRLGAAADDGGWVTTDAMGQTSVAGVWVAGNVANPRAQVITAASEGSLVAAAITHDLVQEDAALALEASRAAVGAAPADGDRAVAATAPRQ